MLKNILALIGGLVVLRLVVRGAASIIEENRMMTDAHRDNEL